MNDVVADSDPSSFHVEASGVVTPDFKGFGRCFNELGWKALQLLDDNERGAVLAAAYVKGMGFQWAGKYSVQRTRQAFPHVPVIQTENECGDGTNSWDYAHYVFDLIQHYLSGLNTAASPIDSKKI